MAVYGRTPWGKKWLETFTETTPGSKFNYNDDRFIRGKRYANSGRVLIPVRTKNLITVLVEGSYRSHYKIQISFNQFSSAQNKIIKNIITKSPSILSALICGQFPNELSDQLLAEQINLFPSSWDDIKAICDCYDYVNPCKHIIAVIYSLSAEIDKNPRLMFDLHDCDLASLVSDLSHEKLEQFKKIASIKELFKKNKYKTNSFDQSILENINFTVIPNLYSQINGMLKDNPLFFDKNFREVLQSCYKHWQKNPYGKDNTYTRITEPEKELSPEELFLKAWPHAEQWNSFQIIIDDKNHLVEVFCDNNPLLKHKYPLHAQFIKFLQDIPYSLVHKLNPDLRLMHLLSQFATKLMEKSGLIPQVILGKRNETFIRWIPTFFNEEINEICNKLASICPPQLVMYGKIPLSPEEQIKTALAVILAGRMERNLPTAADKYNSILDLFFKQKSQVFKKFENKDIPALINQWLSNFYLNDRSYQFYLMIKHKDEGFELQLKIVLDPLQSPMLLTKALKSNPESKLMILSDINKIAEYIPTTTPSICSGKSVFFNIDDFVPLFLKVLPILKAIGIVVALPKSLRKILQPTLSLDLKHKKPSSNNKTAFLQLDELLSFDWKIAIGDKKLSITEFNKLLKNSGGFVKIMGEYVILDEEKMKKLVTQIKNMPNELNNADLMQAILAGQLGDATVCIDDQIKLLFDQLKNYDSVNIPHNLKATLRPYQERGFNWLMQNITTGFGSILADDMGLGKTLQVITVILHLKNQNLLQSKKILIVAPTGLLSNWKREFERFAPDLNIHIYHGPQRNLNTKNPCDVIITSYGHTRSDQKELSEISWLLLVIDEAQNIKNPFTEQTKALKSIPAKYKIAMSGTPVENRLLEYWSIFDFTNKHYLGNAKLFQDRFVGPIEKDRNKNCLEIFKKITSPFILRRLKNDKTIIQDLPDKIENNRYCSLTSEQTVLYQEIVTTTLKQIELSEGITRKGLILSLINSLKQICNHPSQFEKKKIATFDQSHKMQTLKDILVDIDEIAEKSLIFTQYTEMGNIISQLLSEQFNTTIPFLHGGLSRAKRDEMVHNFQNNSQSRILIISLKAGGTGLNLTAANHVIHYDLWWNPAVEAQATDRAYRIGQKSNVMVHRLIVSGTFEERIDEMIQSKKELANLTVGSGESWITEMNSDQLKDLVSLRRDS